MSGELSGVRRGSGGRAVGRRVGGVLGGSSRSHHALVTSVRGSASVLAPVGDVAAAAVAVGAVRVLVANTTSVLVAAVGAVITSVGGGGERGSIRWELSWVCGGGVRRRISGVGGRGVGGSGSGELGGFRSGVFGGVGSGGASRSVGGELGGRFRGRIGGLMSGELSGVSGG